MQLSRSISPRSAYAARLREFPDLVFSEQAVFQHRGQWQEFFSHYIGPTFDGQIIFEVGCFDAGYLSMIATRFPTTGFVGLDWKCKPLIDGAQRIVEQQIKNVALLRGRGQDITKIFADREVDEIWIFHPDPCDKPAELKNRLMAEPFLMDIHRVLRETTASLCLKTDHPGYFESVQKLFESSESVRGHFEVAVISTNYWQDPHAQSATANRRFTGETTLFEMRFLKKRQPIYYIELRKR